MGQQINYAKVTKELLLEFVERRCNSEGKWEGKPGSNHTQGWTNYTSCILPEIWKLMMKLGDKNEKEVTRLFQFWFVSCAETVFK